MSSAKNGTKGAARRANVVRHSWSVEYALRLSGPKPLAQNRGRLARTYQFDSRSMKSNSDRAAVRMSNESRAFVTARVVGCSSETIHRSRRGRWATGGALPGDGVKPSMFA